MVMGMGLEGLGGGDSWVVRERRVRAAVFKMGNQQRPMHGTWRSGQCRVPAWTGGSTEGEWMHAQLSPFTVPLEVPQHC